MPGTYISPAETGLYYLQSRYYNPQWGRFLNADGVMSGIGGDMRGYSLFSYCFNNPVNYIDPQGNWAQWVSGLLNVVGGAFQIYAAAALGASVGWTGVGAVAAGFLVVNGAATITQGVGQIVNDVTDSEILREDNLVRTGVKTIGKTFGGIAGEEMAEAAYDSTVSTISILASTAILDQNMSQIVGSKLFAHNGGYGYKFGKSLELLYQNPNAQGGLGGTIFSYNGYWGKLRLDWDPTNSFHFHPPGHI